MENDKITKIVIIGAGFAYWEIFDLIQDINLIKKKFEIVSILDDNYDIIGKTFNNIKVDGPIKEKINRFNSETKFVFAIGSVNSRLSRKKIIDSLDLDSNRFATLIHPSAQIAKGVKIIFSLWR